MLYFATDSGWFRRFGLALFVAQLGLFILALPPFRDGIWVQIEPVMAGVFLLAVFNCAWLWTGFSKGWLHVQRPLHPLWICLLLWVGWQEVPTAFALSPWRSWFGPPESGEGMGWYVAALLGALLAAPLWQVPSCRKTMLWAAAAGIAILAALHAANPSDSDPWQPMKWSAYLAFMAGWLFVAAMAGHDFKKLVPFLALAAFCLVALHISGNRSAHLLFPYVLLVTGGILWLDITGRYRFRPTRLWRALAMLACVAPMLWPVASQHWQSFPQRRGAIGARAEMNQIAFSAMRHEPARWLAGDGWGRFTDDVFKYGMVDGTWYFHDGDPHPNSYAINGTSFHSHDQPVEALLSLGLPGLLLWLAFPMLALRHLPDRLFWRVAPMLVALVALGYVWFPIAQLLAYQSLFWAALCAACAGENPQPARAPAWPVAALALLGLLMLWSGTQQLAAMRYGDNLINAIATRSYNDYSNAMITNDIKRGGDRMRNVIIHFALQYAAQPPGLDAENAAGWYRSFLRAAHTAALSPRAGARLANFELVLQNILLLNLHGTAFDALRGEAMGFYPAAVTRLAVTAPQREDLAAPYLLYRQAQTHGDIAQQIDLISRLLALDPDHRGALWLLGQALLKKPGHEEEGREMLRRAAALGVGRVWPVTDRELAPFK